MVVGERAPQRTPALTHTCRCTHSNSHFCFTWHSPLFSLWVPKQLVMLIAGTIDGECRLNRASQQWMIGQDPWEAWWGGWEARNWRGVGGGGDVTGAPGP